MVDIAWVVGLTTVSCSIVTRVPYVILLVGAFVGIGSDDEAGFVDSAFACCCTSASGLVICNAILVTLMLPNVSVRTLLALLGSASRIIPIVPMAIHWLFAMRTCLVSLT